MVRQTLLGEEARDCDGLIFKLQGLLNPNVGPKETRVVILNLDSSEGFKPI
jgi:hypothetical protein